MNSDDTGCFGSVFTQRGTSVILSPSYFAPSSPWICICYNTWGVELNVVEVCKPKFYNLNVR